MREGGKGVGGKGVGGYEGMRVGGMRDVRGLLWW